MPSLPPDQWPTIPTQADLHDLQAYQQAICAARGWDQASDLETFLLFTEEVGELAKAIRKRMALYQEAGKASTPDGLPGEFADVFSYLLELSNRFEVNLFEAYVAKEQVNRTRNWS